jgi:hypothetical protein
MRTTTKNKKQKVDQFFCSSNTNTTKTAPEVQLLQKRRLQEGHNAQAPSSLDRKS